MVVATPPPEDIWAPARKGAIRSLRLALDKPAWRIPSTSQQTTFNHALMLSVQGGYADCVAALIHRGAQDPSAEAINHAIADKALSMITLLRPLQESRVLGDCVERVSTMEQFHIPSLDALLHDNIPLPSRLVVINNLALRGNLEGVEHMLRWIPTEHHIEPLLLAAEHDHHHVIRHLKGLCDQEVLADRIENQQRWVAADNLSHHLTFPDDWQDRIVARAGADIVPYLAAKVLGRTLRKATENEDGVEMLPPAAPPRTRI